MKTSHPSPILLVGGLVMKGDESFSLANQLTERLERQVFISIISMQGVDQDIPQRVVSLF